MPLGPKQREAFVSRLDDFLLFKQGATESPGGTYLPEVGVSQKKGFLILGSLEKGSCYPILGHPIFGNSQVEGLEKTTVGVRFKVFTLFDLLPIQAPALKQTSDDHIRVLRFRSYL